MPVTLTGRRRRRPASSGAWGFDEASGATGDGRVRATATPARSPARPASPGTPAARCRSTASTTGSRSPTPTSLDLTTGDDARGVGPARAPGSDWRTVLLKEQTGQLVYALYASTDNGAAERRTCSRPPTTALRGPTALPLNAWSHLAMTWDGATMRALRQRHPGRDRGADRRRASTSTGPLRIGGNGVWPEWFNGVIDEVRVYNRALQRGGDRHRPRHADRRRRAAGAARRAAAGTRGREEAGRDKARRRHARRAQASRRTAAPAGSTAPAVARCSISSQHQDTEHDPARIPPTIPGSDVAADAHPDRVEDPMNAPATTFAGVLRPRGGSGSRPRRVAPARGLGRGGSTPTRSCRAACS